MFFPRRLFQTPWVRFVEFHDNRWFAAWHRWVRFAEFHDSRIPGAPTSVGLFRQIRVADILGSQRRPPCCLPMVKNGFVLPRTFHQETNPRLYSTTTCRARKIGSVSQFSCSFAEARLFVPP